MQHCTHEAQFFSPLGRREHTFFLAYLDINVPNVFPSISHQVLNVFTQVQNHPTNETPTNNKPSYYIEQSLLKGGVQKVLINPIISQVVLTSLTIINQHYLTQDPHFLCDLETTLCSSTRLMPWKNIDSPTFALPLSLYDKSLNESYSPTMIRA